MIKDLIKKYVKARFDRYHTPGHLGKLCAYDITELDNGDFFPNESINVAQDECAKIFACKHLRFLVNGSSVGVKAAIMSVGGDIISAANSHQAVKEGAALAKVNNFIVQNDFKNGLPQPLTVSQIAKAIEDFPSAVAVVITSPDYYGQCCSLEIAELVHAKKLSLIADSAHGAHFAGSRQLENLSFASVADFCNMSAHKTLNAYTQTAYLCINNDDLLNTVDNALTLLGTTSPNYVFLQQLEIAAKQLSTSQTKYQRLQQWSKEFTSCVKCLKNNDFTRLVVDSYALKLTGKSLNQKLLQNKIMVEKYDERYVVFILTPLSTHRMIARLKKVILKKAGFTKRKKQ